ncbi:hypothetical protein H696_02955 [Fonticula alba]|uniref:RING-type domain-containing protein n=1 Tax=Fonticula alba TaxID=691883 RepID=A0A058ZAZ5_FONAL|nr:hypothetical protein H696_02955 [Fonticula alba]KCV70597.1 hypothetical protein H696_02955 [Fonticula alba]|eukprot:XP_009495113.1 hypothetical protein H696_02955 [Fonticula alba]
MRKPSGPAAGAGPGTTPAKDKQRLPQPKDALKQLVAFLEPAPLLSEGEPAHQCIVCTKAIGLFVVGSCGHRLACHTCVIRFRFLCKKKKCLVCNIDLDEVYLTASETASTEELCQLANTVPMPEPLVAVADGIRCTDPSQVPPLQTMLGYVCPVDGHAFTNRKALLAHVVNAHGRSFWSTPVVCRIYDEQLLTHVPYTRLLRVPVHHAAMSHPDILVRPADMRSYRLSGPRGLSSSSTSRRSAGSGIYFAPSGTALATANPPGSTEIAMERVRISRPENAAAGAEAAGSTATGAQRSRANKPSRGPTYWSDLASSSGRITGIGASVDTSRGSGNFPSLADVHASSAGAAAAAAAPPRPPVSVLRAQRAASAAAVASGAASVRSSSAAANSSASERMVTLRPARRTVSTGSSPALARMVNQAASASGTAAGRGASPAAPDTSSMRVLTPAQLPARPAAPTPAAAPAPYSVVGRGAASVAASPPLQSTSRQARNRAVPLSVALSAPAAVGAPWSAAATPAISSTSASTSTSAGRPGAAARSSPAASLDDFAPLSAVYASPTPEPPAANNSRRKAGQPAAANAGQPAPRRVLRIVSTPGRRDALVNRAARTDSDLTGSLAVKRCPQCSWSGLARDFHTHEMSHF